MSGRIGLQYPGAFEGGSGVLSEIDRALAVIGAAHWMEKCRPSPTRSATKHLDQSAALGRDCGKTRGMRRPMRCVSRQDHWDAG